MNRTDDDGMEHAIWKTTVTFIGKLKAWQNQTCFSGSCTNKQQFAYKISSLDFTKL